MMTISETTDLAAKDTALFEAFYQKAAASTQPEWIKLRRAKAFEFFGHSGLPTLHDEEWRYSSFESVRRTLWNSGSDMPGGGTARPNLLNFLPSVVWPRIVFINGSWSSALSSDLGSGLPMLRTAESLHTDEFKSRMGKTARDESRALTALNTALFQDGFFLSLKAGRQPETPMILVDVSLGNSAGVTALRHIFSLGAHSRASIIHVMLELEGTGVFHNGVTEISLAEDATLDYSLFRFGQGETTRVAHVDCSLDRNSRFVSNMLDSGSGLFRNEMRVCLNASGAVCELNGLSLGAGSDIHNAHMRVDHTAPQCQSRQLFKGVLGGRSRVVTEGRVIVREGAQKTDASQKIRNLLLSKDAVADAKPQLEILADDVKCSHGAALGQLEEAHLFYLQSRGISRDAAVRMLAEGFATELTEKLPLAELQSYAAKMIEGYFNSGNLT